VGGVREVTLLGQNVNSYGRGLHEPIRFPELLRRIAGETGIARLRFTTSHPKDLTDELMDCFAALDGLCKHLHLPVQAGSDRILRQMNRGYSSADYLAKIGRLRSLCPDIGLSSDVMVGFPGETETDFQETLQLLEQVEFDMLFSFRYSDRPPARASHFADKIPEPVKVRRLVELQALQAEITLRRNRAEVGLIREVLVEGPSKAGSSQLTGRTQQNRIVNFTGSKDLIGRLVSVRVTTAFTHSLQGLLVSSTE
jgi:tRNA-2-methylthio-N6-dimethylallyladenosine synthase